MADSALEQSAQTDLAEFGAAFDTFKRSAFRLEALEFYTIPEEAEFFARYMAGEKKSPVGFNGEWVDVLNHTRKRGAVVTRVRAIRAPFHDYLKFEVAWGYTINLLAGENIRSVPESFLLSTGREVQSLKDFWLFDNSICYLLEYDVVGRFLGVTRVQDDDLQRYLVLREKLVASSEDIRNTELWRVST